MPRTDPPNFREWLQSPANPLRNASSSAQYFTQDALHAAFLAGAKYGAHVISKYRVIPKSECETNIFEKQIEP